MAAIIHCAKFRIVKKGFLLVCLLSLSLSHVFAQKGWEVGGWFGVSNYFGDLNTSFDVSSPGLAGGAIFRYNFNERLSLKATVSYANLSADDADSNNPYEVARNLSFQSRILDFSPQIEFNFLPYIHGSEDLFFSPYLLAGINIFSFNPKAELNGELVELRPLGTEGQFKGEEYYTVQGGLVYGMGVKVDINEVWSVNVEFSGRALFTDYLDDVSTVYPDKTDLAKLRGDRAVLLSDRSIVVPGVDEPIGDAGRQRGNRSNNDAYVFLGVGVVYYFGDLRCPEYSR